MEVLVLDRKMQPVDIIEDFSSLIWTDRYGSFGDFEICSSADDYKLNRLLAGEYLKIPESNKVMIVEDKLYTSDPENGNTITVTGRSLESILDRRIVWTPTVVSGTIQECVERLLNENIISPKDPTRKIPNFRYEPTTDEIITSIILSAQYYGETVYDAIVDMCDVYGIGFSITIDSSNFVFQLFTGEDRTGRVLTNPKIVLSGDNENLVNGDYLMSISTFKNVAHVSVETKTDEIKMIQVYGGDHPPEGLERREIHTDAGYMSSKDDSGEIPPEEYDRQLTEKGKETLQENRMVTSFEGEVKSFGSLVYRKNYFLGDIVRISNDYGIDAESMISEVVISHDGDGFTIFPTLMALT